jgi:C4-dicarboxylate transporter, DctM subunit
MATTLFLIFICFLLLQMPVSFCLAISTVLAMYVASDIDTIAIVLKLFRASGNYHLIAVPFFILAGGFMESGGISRRLVSFASNLIGHVRGGLANASVGAAMFFAGISGAAAADTAAVGSLLIPAMKRKGYGSDIATSVMATAGSIGIIIPPSIPMIILGVTASVSIGGLFMGGVIPGIMMGCALMVVNFIYCKVRNIEPEPRVPMKQLIRSFGDSILAIITVVIIVGGIVGGIFTATEASVVAAIYAFLVGFFVYKELTLKDLPGIFVKSAVTTGVVVFTVAAASGFGWILTAENIPVMIAEFVISLSDQKWVIMMLLNALFLVMGTFLDPSAIIIIIVPIVWPIIMKLGIEPIHFGIAMIVNMAIGQCTPPVGIALFVASGISGISLNEVLGCYWKYLLAMVIVLLLVIFFPFFSTWLPTMAGYIQTY